MLAAGEDDQVGVPAGCASRGVSALALALKLMTLFVRLGVQG
jgi:hypothetical protein